MALRGYGALAGLGQGLASVGQQMMADSSRADHDRRVQEAREELQRERLAAAQAKGGKGSGIDLGQLVELARNPGALRSLRELGGMSPEDATDLATLSTGGTPMRTMERDPSVDGRAMVRDIDEGRDPTQVSTPKYVGGEAAKVYERGFQALRRAIGLTKIESADNVAKAEATEQQTGYAREYAETGRPGAARGALLTAGKDTFSPTGTDLGTGAPAPGSVAEAERKEKAAGAVEKYASAEEKKANAVKFKADADKIRAEASGDLRKASAEKLTTALNSINGLIRTYDEKSLDDDSIAARRTLQTLATRIAGLLSSKHGIDVNEKGEIIDKPGAAPAAPSAAASGALKVEPAAEAPPVSVLKAGVNTRFKNGQVWTLRDGKPVRVR